MKQWIQSVSSIHNGPRSLQYDEAVAAAHAIARGEATDSQLAAFLMALRMKGETLDEQLGFLDVFRKYSKPYTSFSNSVACAGSYEGRETFTISLPVSLLLASVGFPQVIYGSHSHSPIVGASINQIVDGLGVVTDLPIRAWEQIFCELHIGFMCTDSISTSIGRMRSMRDQIGVRTMINTIEKVINPVGSQNIVIGADRRSVADTYVSLLPKAGYDTAYIIQGMEGSEDLPLHKSTTVRKVTNWADESIVITPEMFGFKAESLPKQGAEDQLKLLLRVMEGDATPETETAREHVIFNAGLRLYWFDKVSTYEEGFQLARSLLQRKEALKMLFKWKERSMRYDTEHRSQANG